MLGGDCIKVFPRGQIAKIHIYLETFLKKFSQKFDRDSYFTSTTGRSTFICREYFEKTKKMQSKTIK